MRYLFLIFLGFFLPNVTYTQINCPPDTEIECYQLDDFFENIVIETNKLELIPERISGDSSCDTYTLTVGYFKYFVDEDEKETTPTCVRNIQVNSFDPADITWPDSLVFVSDIDNLSTGQLSEGLFPGIYNRCNLIYTYEDLDLGGPSVPRKLVRRWIALDWCSAQTFSFTQLIKEDLAQVNGLFVDASNCSGDDLQLEDFEIRLNDVIVDDNLCDFTTLLGVLNCVANDNDLSSSDTLSLTFTTTHTPRTGVSTIDLVKIQRHILGLKKFTDPCSVWAADVTGDNKINGSDLIELRKFILGVTTALPSGHPELFLLDGKIAGELIFTGDDFPLTDLELTHTTKGNVGN